MFSCINSQDVQVQSVKLTDASNSYDDNSWETDGRTLSNAYVTPPFGEDNTATLKGRTSQPFNWSWPIFWWRADHIQTVWPSTNSFDPRTCAVYPRINDASRSSLTLWLRRTSYLTSYQSCPLRRHDTLLGNASASSAEPQSKDCLCRQTVG